MAGLEGRVPLIMAAAAVEAQGLLEIVEAQPLVEMVVLGQHPLFLEHQPPMLEGVVVEHIKAEPPEQVEQAVAVTEERRDQTIPEPLEP